MEITKQVLELNDELIGLRRDLHRHPELGYEEFRTSQKVVEYLENAGLQVSRITKTGVVGLLSGKRPGRTVMLRADLDALPIQEENDIPYKSIHEGRMHACGHDGHTAMLMVAAKILARCRDKLKGNIKFVFQPNEESVGALAMIEEGVLESPKVDAGLGIHLWSTIESGKIAINPGPVMAGMDHFEIGIKGRGGHTSTPEHSVDPILTAAAVIQAVQAIQTREISVLQPTVIVFGKISGGTATNIIPDQVALAGTMRYLHDSDASREDLRERLERIVSGTCKTYRAEGKVSFLGGHPSLINDPALTDMVRTVAAGVLSRNPDGSRLSGGAAKRFVSYVSMAGEDFSEFATRVPAVFYFLGAGNPAKGACYPHHHPRFNIDEDVLATGVEMHVRTALQYLELP
jgi:amidohydrolase